MTDEFDAMEEAIARALEERIIEPLLNEDGQQVWKVGPNGPQKVYRSLIYKEDD